jgi:hypothetical protein
VTVGPSLQTINLQKAQMGRRYAAMHIQTVTHFYQLDFPRQKMLTPCWRDVPQAVISMNAHCADSLV